MKSNIPCIRSLPRILHGLAISLAAFGLLAPPTAHATTLTWDNTSGGVINDGAGAWLSAGLWNNGAPSATWTSGDDAIFGNGGGGGAVTLASPTTVNSLTFNSFTGTYTLGTAAQTITLNTGITKTSTGAATIISPVILGAAQIWTNNSAGLLTVGTGAVTNGGFLLTVGGTGNTTISSVLGSGAGGLTKNGLGTLILSGANTYTGSTNINLGTLQIGAGAAAGSLSSSSTITNNGILAFNRTGTITQGTNFASGVSGTGLVLLTGTGTVVLSGTNSYSGGTIINAGVLRSDALGALGGSGRNVAAYNSGAVALGYAPGGSIQSDLLSRIVSTSTGAFALAANSSESFDFSSGGPGNNFTSLSLGAVGSATYTGTLTPNGTTYRLGGGGGTLTFTPAGYTSGNDLLINGNGLTGTVDFGGLNKTFGAITIAGGTVQNGILTGTSFALQGGTISGTATLAGTGTALTKTGSGTLTFSGSTAQTFTGGLIVNAGTVAENFANLTASPNNNLMDSGNVLTLGGGTLSLTGKSNTASLQTFASTTTSANSGSTITLAKSGTGTMTIGLGAITHNTGSNLNFSAAPDASTILATTSTGNTSGILGPWATVGSGAAGATALQYATVSGGQIIRYPDASATVATAADLSNVLDKDANYSLTPPSSTVGAALTGPITANTIRVNSSMSANAAIANAGNSITLNGLIGVGTGRTIISGAGNLVIGASKELVVNWAVGFSSITCPVVNNPGGASAVILNFPNSENTFGATGATNTYTGGTTINNPPGGQLNCYAGSFGSGPITLNAGALRFNYLSAADFSNSLTINGVDYISGTTFAGPITLNASAFVRANVSGNISGPGGVSFNVTGVTRLFSGVNTYTGPTTVTLGTLKAGRASMANVSGAFGLNSAVTIANSSAAILDLNGFDTQIGSLTGGGTTGGNVINSHASIAATLTVGGDNTSPAAYAGLVSGARLALAKTGTGKQTLSGANTYTGDTVVQNGTLSLSPAVAGGYLADTADVKLYTGGILELNTGSTDTIRSLYLDGVPQAAGEWGSATSGAANQSALFTGTGKLNVGTPGSTLTYSISGTVTLNGVGLSGVTVSDGTRSATTASNGTYTISAVPDAATYTVTASLGGYTLTPSSVAVTVKGTNVTGNNYTAAAATGTITLTGPLGAVNTTYGTASVSPTSFTVSGTGLTPASDNLTVAALSGYEYSTSLGGNYTSTLLLPYSGSALSSTSVFVRLAATASVGSSPYAGNISVSGGGATAQTIATASSAVSAASLTITANNQNKPFGTTQTTPVTGSTAFAAVGLQNGETVGSVTLTYGSGGLLDTDPVGSTSTITPSAATGGTFAAGNYSISYTPDSGTLTVIPVPVVTLGGTLAAVDTTYGTASVSPTSFTVSASDLTPASGDLTVTPPSGYEVSSGSGYAPTLLLPYTGSALSSTTVYVRLAATTAVNGGAGYAGNITVAGGSASQTIATASSTVAKATATVVVAPYTVTYNGAPHSASVGTITGVNGQSGATVGTVTLSTTHTAAGTYGSDSWSFTGTANYNNIGSTTITNTIDKATATVVVTPYTVAYDGAPHSATVTSITGVNGETGAMVGTVTLPAAHTNAGTYNTDAWSFTGTANYNDIGSTTITNTINKATPIAPTPTPSELAVNGSFETGTVPGNGSHENLANSGVTGWTTGGTGGVVWYMVSSAWGGGPAGGGNMLVNVNGNMTISQSLAVSAGTEYTVSYYEKKRGTTGYMDATLSVAAGTVAGANGTPVAIAAGPAASIVQTTSVNNGWTLHTFKFTPNTTTTATLTFGNVYGGGRGGDNDGVFLDNVSVIGAGGSGGLAATPIIEGQALSASTLSGTFKNAAGATVAGALTFDSPTTTPAAGIYSAAVTFTPADADNYNIWTGTVSVTVAAAYSVTYDANGATSGTVPSDGNTYAPAATVTVLGNTGSLAKTGYAFTGWNSAADGTGTHYGANFAMGTSSVTLYAEWKTPYEAWLNGETATDENLKEFAFGTANTGALVLNGDGTIHTRGQAPIIQTTVGSALVTLTYARLKNSGCTYSTEFSDSLGAWLPGNDPSLIYPPGVPTEVVVDNGDDMEVVSVKFPIFRDNGASYEKMAQDFCRIAVTTN